MFNMNEGEITSMEKTNRPYNILTEKTNISGEIYLILHRFRPKIELLGEIYLILRRFRPE